MKLTKTPSSRRVHDYNLALTKDELITLARGDFEADMRPWDDLMDKFFKLLEVEAKRLGSGE